MQEKKRRFINDEFAISQESYETGWTMPYAHYHNDYEIYILESGSRTVKISDHEYTTAAYDAVFFRPNIPHKSRGESAFSGICIHFSESYLTKHMTSNSKQLLMKCFESPIIHLSENTFAVIKQYAERFTLSLPDNFVILINILSLLNTQRISADDEAASAFSNNAGDNTSHCASTPSHNKSTSSKSLQILEFVEENYISVSNITELSKQFAVTESYIFKIYKRTYNQTPKQHINELRINNACHRLKNSDATISRIATDCGYDCYEYFIRVFKRIKKCTPSEYRKSARM